VPCRIYSFKLGSISTCLPDYLDFTCKNSKIKTENSFCKCNIKNYFPDNQPIDQKKYTIIIKNLKGIFSPHFLGGEEREQPEFIF